MNNPEKLATLGTQDIRGSQTKKNTKKNNAKTKQNTQHNTIINKR